MALLQRTRSSSRAAFCSRHTRPGFSLAKDDVSRHRPRNRQSPACVRVLRCVGGYPGRGLVDRSRGRVVGMFSAALDCPPALASLVCTTDSGVARHSVHNADLVCMGRITFFNSTLSNTSNNRISRNNVFCHGLCPLSFREERHLVDFQIVSLGVKYDGFKLEAEIQ